MREFDWNSSHSEKVGGSIQVLSPARLFLQSVISSCCRPSYSSELELYDLILMVLAPVEYLLRCEKSRKQ
ncbi:hypothetical protein RB195_003963 [Necator americanus]|uniref:Uncharacterized protein n=1 Tax=Necator americanus TaxID=51031 RepID=A0ABR1DR18_NECAM